MISFGTLSVEQFKAKIWQKKPLLVRAALRQAESLISTQELLALSQNGQCESRLIARKPKDSWHLEHGPFKLPSQGSWTVLVQGVDTVNERINQLMHAFRFAGDALLDDVMISYATDGGGVGPHLDSYDVFLIQLHGKRRWRISAPAATKADFVDGLPIKILKRFTATQEWLLEPGDMLYLPPGWGHDGVAQGTCMTASVGFRAPHRNEWLNAYLDDLSDSLEDVLSQNSKRLKVKVPKLPNSNAAAHRPAQLVADIPTQFGEWVEELLGTGVAQKPVNKAHIRELSGRFLTEPKSQSVFNPPKTPLSLTAFEKRLAKTGIRLSLASRCLYSKTPHIFFLNGESFRVSASQMVVLAELGDTKQISPANTSTTTKTRAVDNDIVESLHQWYENGWIELLSPKPSS
jgi:50S ribosomal protein L16 3-hydroxylase